MRAPAAPLPPGSVIGVFGGGQLGRMLSLSAATLGFDVHIFCDEADSPAARVSARDTVAAYDDDDAVRSFAACCDVVTLEFENIPLRTIEAAARWAPVRPALAALDIAQDRIKEKAFAHRCGADVAPHAAVDSLEDLTRAVQTVGLPGILKTRRLGYDGKGQVRIDGVEDIQTAFDDMAGRSAIFEALAPFEREVSLVAARGLDGATAFYNIVENQHENGILRRTIAPAGGVDVIAEDARAVSAAMMSALDYVGVLTVEFFQVDGRLLVNEIAPRVHNSGHWTWEGAVCSQFEQHIRAIAGWPLGDPTRRGAFVMRNLLGHEIDTWAEAAQRRGVHLHHYGKRTSVEGRKMGHVTTPHEIVIAPDAV